MLQEFDSLFPTVCRYFYLFVRLVSPWSFDLYRTRITSSTALSFYLPSCVPSCLSVCRCIRLDFDEPFRFLYFTVVIFPIVNCLVGTANQKTSNPTIQKKLNYNNHRYFLFYTLPIKNSINIIESAIRTYNCVALYIYVC